MRVAFIDKLMSAVWLFLALLLLGIISFVFSYRFKFRCYSTIVLLDRKEEVSFWKRNRDQILVTIIAAVASSLVTVFVLWILKIL